jgi:hypothetical protein
MDPLQSHALTSKNNVTLSSTSNFITVKENDLRLPNGEFLVRVLVMQSVSRIITSFQERVPQSIRMTVDCVARDSVSQDSISPHKDTQEQDKARPD